MCVASLLTLLFLSLGSAVRLVEDAESEVQARANLTAHAQERLYCDDDEEDDCEDIAELPAERRVSSAGVWHHAEAKGLTWPKDVMFGGTTKCNPKDEAKCVATFRYHVPKNLEDPGSLMEAISIYKKELAGCVNFEAVDSKDTAKVPFYLLIKQRDDGFCANAIGRKFTDSVKKGDSQTFHVSPRCFYRGSFLHELGHSLGLTHKQNRMDRNDWIKVNFAKVLEGKAGNFNRKWITLGWSQVYEDDYYTYDPMWSDLTQPFDVRSIMMYKFNHFSEDGSNVMLPTKKLLNTWNQMSETHGRGQLIDPHTDEKWTAGHRDYLSGYDLQALRHMYKCNPPPEQQVYEFVPLDWDVVFKRKLGKHAGAQDGWSQCPVPCQDREQNPLPFFVPVQRRLVVCKGNVDKKTYEDERCTGQLPRAKQSCESLSACEVGSDAGGFVDVFGLNCKAYQKDPTLCLRFGDLGARRFCGASCGGNNLAGVKPPQKPQWSKPAKMFSCKETGVMVDSWQRDVCRNHCYKDPRSSKCSSCLNKNYEKDYGTLGACKKSCIASEECRAITVAFQSVKLEEQMLDTATLTHCKIFNECKDFSITGYHFHTFWFA